jgi:hypothetical protein
MNIILARAEALNALDGGWTPDWGDCHKKKYGIEIREGKVCDDFQYVFNVFIAGAVVRSPEHARELYNEPGLKEDIEKYWGVV